MAGVVALRLADRVGPRSRDRRGALPPRVGTARSRACKLEVSLLKCGLDRVPLHDTLSLSMQIHPPYPEHVFPHGLSSVTFHASA